MVNINSENFFINLWNTFPHPSFVISKNFRIINLNSAVENLFITSKKKLQEKKINDFVEKGSLLLKVIDQTILNKLLLLFMILIFIGIKKNLVNLMYTLHLLITLLIIYY